MNQKFLSRIGFGENRTLGQRESFDVKKVLNIVVAGQSSVADISVFEPVVVLARLYQLPLVGQKLEVHEQTLGKINLLLISRDLVDTVNMVNFSKLRYIIEIGFQLNGLGLILILHRILHKINFIIFRLK